MEESSETFENEILVEILSPLDSLPLWSSGEGVQINIGFFQLASHTRGGEFNPNIRLVLLAITFDFNDVNIN